ncbi:hypothetical protein E3P77_03358 [Wallemia ichthyophaga]|nr:hypothetical protein E3P77_03358 [Wallemia ichthyophaga]
MIQVEKKSDRKVEPNLLPFSIDYEGVADISTYFHRVNNVAAFRGRRITAKGAKLGEGMIGMCVKEVLPDIKPTQPKKRVKSTKYSMDDDNDEDVDHNDSFDAHSTQNSDNDNHDNQSIPYTHQDTRQTFHSTGHTFTDFNIWMPDEHVAESTHPLCRLEEQQKLFALINATE